MISGMLNLQARSTTRPEVKLQLEEARSRVMMIARIHARLEHKDGHSSVMLDGLLRDVTSDLSRTLLTPDGATVALELEAAPIEVPIEKAAPIVLALNELITNSVKHSFVGRGTGEIRVSLTQVGANDALLVVEDDGVGLPPGFDPAASSGLGMGLIVGLVRQLRGTLTHGTGTKGGARFDVTFALGDGEDHGAEPAAASPRSVEPSSQAPR
jgi:two-component sensor histidine kinase